MRVQRLIWLPDIVDKLESKHNVDQVEVEEVLFGQHYLRKVRRGYQPGEHVYAALGQTEAGRYLIVFFVLKVTGEALIISARAMENDERRDYERR